MVYGYLRVSTLEQDEANQKQGIKQKAADLSLHIDKYIVDKKSGIKEPNERNLGKLIKRLKPGDIIIVSEISRLSRRLFMLFRILENLLNKDIKVYSVKDSYNLDNSLQSKVLAFAFGIAAEIERDMISMRTKEALALRKSMGIKLGRPKGAKTKVHKLDRYKQQIVIKYTAGISKLKLSKYYKVSYKTMRKYIDIYLKEINTGTI